MVSSTVFIYMQRACVTKWLRSSMSDPKPGTTDIWVCATIHTSASIEVSRHHPKTKGYTDQFVYNAVLSQYGLCVVMI